MDWPRTVIPLTLLWAVRVGYRRAGAVLHDSIPIAWLIDESVVKLEDYNVQIELNGELTRGYTKESLKKLLTSSLITDKESSSGKEKSLAGRVFSRWKK